MDTRRKFYILYVQDGKVSQMPQHASTEDLAMISFKNTHKNKSILDVKLSMFSDKKIADHQKELASIKNKAIIA